MRAFPLLAALAAFVSFATDLSAADSTLATLAGRAVLPANTFLPGPTSGAFLGKGPINGVAVPFDQKQPVQGFSSLIALPDGDLLALIDNGFGKQENSADSLLRIYRLRVDFKRPGASVEGAVTVVSAITLADPDRKILFPIVNELTRERLLTGSDFDPESMQLAPDGTIWIGDEFGPFLLHVDGEGKLLDPPFPLPDYDHPGRELRSPENPYRPWGNMVRLMQAARAHARAHGALQTPVLSPSGRLAPLIDVPRLRAAGFPIVLWTVNDKKAILEALKLGVDGIISDRPDLLREAVQEFDANGDGKAGDLIGPDGLIDATRFDAQGHRGGRNIRPESTLPAMEASLDLLMTTLECDCGVTKDGVPIIRHDAQIEPFCARRVDGAPYSRSNQVLIKNLTAADIQATFIADKLLPNTPSQKRSRDLSPVSVAFAKANKMLDPYTIPTLDQLFAFVDFYANYYDLGVGKGHPESIERVRNARRVRFNIETKVEARPGRTAETVGPIEFAEAVAGRIVANKRESRADIQSFDWRSLIHVQEKYPAIRTVYLVDGAGLVGPPSLRRPWLAGMAWVAGSSPGDPPRVPTSGGIEGMALSPNGFSLWPMLEKPLIGDTTRTLLIHEFNLASKAFTKTRRRYPLDTAAISIGDFQLLTPTHGLVIERDDSQGKLDGFKRVYVADFSEAGKPAKKRFACDLLRIADPAQISLPAPSGDVGVGERFAFPFWTIESVLPLGPNRLLLVNDNNFPFGLGRHLKTGAPDDSEFILIDLPQTLLDGNTTGANR